MAGIQSHYEINVSQNGKHIFATASRSLIYYEEAKKLTKVFTEKFPKSEGYEVSCTHYECVGNSVTFKED